MPELFEALTREDKKRLYDDFFTLREILAFNSSLNPDETAMQHIDIDGKLWKAVRKRRRDAALALKKQGFTDTEIRKQFARAGKQKGAPSPFDFLKVEYEPAVKTRDYQDTVGKIKKKITSAYGPGYFSKSAALRNPKYNPVRRPIGKRK